MAQPHVPEHPTERDCAAFSNAYYSYLKTLQAEYYACDQANQSVPTSQWRRGYRCTVSVDVPPTCVEPSNRWDCANREYGHLQQLCSSRISKISESSDPSRQALTNSGSSLASRAALRAANFLVENGKNEEAKALLKSVGIAKKFSDTTEAIKTITNSGSPPDKRIEQLMKLGAASIHNPLSADLTKAAIEAAINTNKAAMSDLDKELQETDLSARIEKQKQKSLDADRINRTELEKVEQYAVGQAQEAQRQFQYERAPDRERLERIRRENERIRIENARIRRQNDEALQEAAEAFANGFLQGFGSIPSGRRSAPGGGAREINSKACIAILSDEVSGDAGCALAKAVELVRAAASFPSPRKMQHIIASTPI
jgi:hypothetical protein